MTSAQNSVWIFSGKSDPHARIVKSALAWIEINSHLIDSSDFPVNAQIEHRIEQNSICGGIGEPKNYHQDSDCGVAWIRRPQQPKTHPRLHAADKAFSIAESESALRGLFYSMELRGIKFINPILGRTLARYRGVQLEVARISGLNIPRTLISNCPGAVRDFVNEQSRGCVYKTSSPNAWVEANGDIFQCLTTAVDCSTLTDDVMVSASPGCYQSLVVKAFDVRALYLNGNLVCAALKSKNFKLFESDWRAHKPESIDVWPVSAPQSVIDGCRSFAERMGIVFGCFDFVVDAAGKWFFLEVNEAGQFLFIEYFNPEIKILSPFVEMLISFKGHAACAKSRSLQLNDFFH